MALLIASISLWPGLRRRRRRPRNPNLRNPEQKRGGGQCGVAAGLGPRSELPPGRGIGPAGVPGLGVPEACGTGPGRTTVALRQIQGVVELLDDGQIGGHGRLG